MDTDNNSEQFRAIDADAIDFSEVDPVLDEPIDSIQFWAKEHHCSSVQQHESTSGKRFNFTQLNLPQHNIVHSSHSTILLVFRI